MKSIQIAFIGGRFILGLAISSVTIYSFLQERGKTGVRVYQEDRLQGAVKHLNMTFFSGQEWVFQQHSVPAPKAKTTQEWLRRNLPAFISAENWLSWSADLTTLDNKLRAVLEDMACWKCHNSLESLRRSLVKAAAEIPLEMERAVTAEWPEHNKACVKAQGGHFEWHYYKLKLKIIWLKKLILCLIFLLGHIVFVTALMGRPSKYWDICTKCNSKFCNNFLNMTILTCLVIFTPTLNILSPFQSLYTNWCTSFFKRSIKIYIKTGPTCFGAVTPSSGSALFELAKVTFVKTVWFQTVQQTYTNKDLTIYADTPPD